MALRHFRRLLLGEPGRGQPKTYSGLSHRQIGGDVDRLFDLGRHDELAAAAVFPAGSPIV